MQVRVAYAKVDHRYILIQITVVHTNNLWGGARPLVSCSVIAKNESTASFTATGGKLHGIGSGAGYLVPFQLQLISGTVIIST